MLIQFCFKATREKAPLGADLTPDLCDSAGRANFSHLPSDEIERLIALCEAPALLWLTEPEPVRAPEPFGMIA